MEELTTRVQGSRGKIWLFTLATALLAPLLNFVIGLVTSIDLASFAVYTFIPVGTFALCALACSGFIYGSKDALYMPDVVDLVFLMAVSVGAIALTFLVEYAYLIIRGHATAAQLGGFRHFVATTITNAQYQSYSRPFGLEGPLRAGEGGFLIAFVRIPAAAAVAKIVHSTMVSRAVNMS
jgi:hypothetical protein